MKAIFKNIKLLQIVFVFNYIILHSIQLKFDMQSKNINRKDI